MMYQPPILITGAPRSGASMIAGSMNLCGAYGGTGLNKMFENPEVNQLMEQLMKRVRADASGMFPMPQASRVRPVKGIADQLWSAAGSPTGAWFVKDSRLLLTPSIWVAAFPEARWVVVKRTESEVVQSCMKTYYMNRFNTEEGWRWMYNQYQLRYNELSLSARHLSVIRPAAILEGDVAQFRKTVEWAGLRWNDEVVDYMFYKLRKMAQ